jgi:hypothetical protein
METKMITNQGIYNTESAKCRIQKIEELADLRIHCEYPNSSFRRFYNS